MPKRLLALASILSAIAAACGGGGSLPKTNATPISQADRVSTIEKSTVLLVGRQGNRGTVGGSGVVVDAKKGFVLTNAHVVSGVSALKITFDDGTDSPGAVVGKNPCDDLAVVKIVNNPGNLRALAIGDSTKVRAGDHVTAVGYPASLQSQATERPTATEGSVSTPDVSAEPDPSLPKYSSLIQHQAPINPGNSGGPLVSDKMELIGINTLANTIQGDRIIQGQSYAISTKKIKQDLVDLESGKSSFDLGWRLLPTDADLIQAVHDLGGYISSTAKQDQGMYVVSVDAGSPADEAHLSPDLEVVSIESAEVKTFQQVCDIVQSHTPGQTLRVKEYDPYVNGTEGGGLFMYVTIKLR